jgi:hypothetical protein
VCLALSLRQRLGLSERKVLLLLLRLLLHLLVVVHVLMLCERRI